MFLLAVPCPLRFVLLLPLPCSLSLTLSLLLLFFLLVLDPHFEDLGRHFSSFGQPMGTLGATLGAIGHHLGNHVDPRVKMRSSSGAPGQLRCPIWGNFLSIVQPKLNNFFENLLPKTIPQPNAFFIRFLCNFSDPRTLIFELSPARERNFQKTTYIATNC